MKVLTKRNLIIGRKADIHREWHFVGIADVSDRLCLKGAVLFLIDKPDF